MSEKSSSSDQAHQKVEVEPRGLPERYDPAGDPFEQLNQGARPAERDSSSVIQPRDLPERDPSEELSAREERTLRQAARLLQEGKSREEVAKQLQIEPLKLRRWETAYHQFFQKDLNDGDYHNTDAQLRDMPDDAREKFHDNWEQVLEKETERRVKVGPTRAKLMAMPWTRWLFRNDHGDLDFGTIGGVFVALIALGVTMVYINNARSNPVAEDVGDDELMIGGDLSTVQHDPKEAARAIVAFHRTKTWEEKLDYVIDPERVKPLMEEWYTKHPEDVYLERITFHADQEVDDGGRNFFIVAIQGGDEDQNVALDRPFYMAVEKRPGGYRVHWEISSGYEQMPMEEFIANKVTTPTEFRLQVELSDYYNFDFQDDQWISFSATKMGMIDPIFIYGKRNDPEILEIESLLKIVARPKGVIVKLRFPDNATVSNQAEITEMVSSSWFRS